MDNVSCTTLLTSFFKLIHAIYHNLLMLFSRSILVPCLQLQRSTLEISRRLKRPRMPMHIYEFRTKARKILKTMVGWYSLCHMYWSCTDKIAFDTHTQVQPRIRWLTPDTREDLGTPLSLVRFLGQRDYIRVSRKWPKTKKEIQFLPSFDH